MKKILISNDYGHGPMWFYDDNGNLTESFDVVKNDEEVWRYSDLIEELFDSYLVSNKYETYVDKNRMNETKDLMSKYITLLIRRLEKINDGSYIIENKEK